MWAAMIVATSPRALWLRAQVIDKVIWRRRVGGSESLRSFLDELAHRYSKQR